MSTYKKPAEDKIRISLDVDKSHKERIDKLMKDAEINTLAELFRKSLRLYEMTRDLTKAGGKVFFENPDGSTVEIRFL